MCCWMSRVEYILMGWVVTGRSGPTEDAHHQSPLCLPLHHPQCSNPFTFFLVSGPLHHQCQSGWRAWLSSILQHHNNYACPVLEQFTRLSFVHGWRARLSSHPLIFEALYSSLQPFHFCLFLVSRPQPFIFEALYSSLQPFHFCLFLASRPQPRCRSGWRAWLAAQACLSHPQSVCTCPPRRHLEPKGTYTECAFISRVGQNRIYTYIYTPYIW